MNRYIFFTKPTATARTRISTTRNCALTFISLAAFSITSYALEAERPAVVSALPEGKVVSEEELQRIYDEVKGRPLYVVRATRNLEVEDPKSEADPAPLRAP